MADHAGLTPIGENGQVSIARAADLCQVKQNPCSSIFASMSPKNFQVRFSLKSLLVLMTITGILTFYFNYFRYYHFKPREVQVGSFHVLTYKPGLQVKLKCDCEIYLSTNYHDILQPRISEGGKELRQKVLEAFRAVSCEEMCVPGLVGLRTQIKDCIKNEVGSFQGHELINEVVLSEFSFMEVPADQ